MKTERAGFAACVVFIFCLVRKSVREMTRFFLDLGTVSA
jgi:hypothetical protein